MNKYFRLTQQRRAQSLHFLLPLDFAVGLVADGPLFRADSPTVN